MNEKEVAKYCSQKRLQIMLNAKFELQKNIRSTLLGEHENITPAYQELFEAFENVIKQEIKFLNEI